MSKWLKITYSLLGLVLLSLLGYLVWLGARDLSLPPTFNWLYTSFSLTRFWETIAYNYVFWMALALFILTLLLILVVVFYPRTHSEFKLEENRGSLMIKKSAIDGLVKSLVQEQGFMANPSVKTKLYKKRFAVRVSGEALPQYDILQKTKNLQERLVAELEACFGLKQRLDFKVLVKHVTNRDTSKSKVKTSRVQ